MPRVSTEYAHVAVTDHRILRRPAPAETRETGPKTLAPWVDPPAGFRRRNLVLADLTVGVKLRMPGLLADGLKELEALPPAQRSEDSAVLAAACQAMLDRGRPREAVAVCRRSAEKQPERADRAMNLGAALARSGDLSGAEQQFTRAIRLDPGLKHAYVELWTLYDRQGKLRERAETAQRYLTWNPRNIMFRLLETEPAGPR